MSVRILTGDCREVLRSLPDESVHCVVTSPPYWGLRDYGNGDVGIGLEPTLPGHLAALVEVFREVRRVLRKDGTVWLNYGDAYAGSWGAQSRGEAPGPKSRLSGGQVHAAPKGTHTGSVKRTPGLKPKDRMLLPARLAIALCDDGWWVRDEIVWHKPNPMPSPARGRTTPAHEMLYMLTRSAQYAFDQDAFKEPASSSPDERAARKVKVPGGWETKLGAHGTIHREGRTAPEYVEATASEHRNKRSVWSVATAPFADAHFATFPPELIEPCIAAGCPVGGVVLDPFGGAGTVGLVADRLQRDAILIELNPEYVAMARQRIERDATLFAAVKAETAA